VLAHELAEHLGGRAILLTACFEELIPKLSFNSYA